jgi:hypothetical protein
MRCADRSAMRRTAGRTRDLARERHKPIQPAAGTPKSGEAASKTTAAQKVAKLLFDNSRKPLAVP